MKVPRVPWGTCVLHGCLRKKGSALSRNRAQGSDHGELVWPQEPAAWATHVPHWPTLLPHEDRSRAALLPQLAHGAVLLVRG